MATRDMPGDTGSSADRFYVSGSTPGYPQRDASERMAEEGSDVAQAGNRILGAARSRVRSAFEHQQQRAAEELGGVASALHNAADQLNQQNRGNAARFADTAAERVERFAETLRRRDVDDLLGQAEGFARRQPEVFIGGAFVIGFLFARFVKSSGERRGGATAWTDERTTRLSERGQGSERSQGYAAGSIPTRPDIAGTHPTEAGIGTGTLAGARQAGSITITSQAARTREPVMAGPKPSIGSSSGSSPSGKNPTGKNPTGRTP